ncbi:MAG: hypothetical protein ACYC5H_04680 [Methylovirgula sp.]
MFSWSDSRHFDMQTSGRKIRLALQGGEGGQCFGLKPSVRSNDAMTYDASDLIDLSKIISIFFYVSLWIKGVFVVCKIAAGIATYFVTQQFLLGLVQ